MRSVGSRFRSPPLGVQIPDLRITGPIPKSGVRPRIRNAQQLTIEWAGRRSRAVSRQIVCGDPQQRLGRLRTRQTQWLKIQAVSLRLLPQQVPVGPARLRELCTVPMMKLDQLTF